MLRTCVLSCAVAGLLGLTVGCKVETTPSSISITTHESAVKDAEAKLKAIDASMAEFKTRVEKATGKEKEALETKWKATEAKRAEAAKKLEELKKAAADKWKDLHRDASTALDDVKKSMD